MSGHKTWSREQLAPSGSGFGIRWYLSDRGPFGCRGSTDRRWGGHPCTKMGIYPVGWGLSTSPSSRQGHGVSESGPGVEGSGVTCVATLPPLLTQVKDLERAPTTRTCVPRTGCHSRTICPHTSPRNFLDRSDKPRSGSDPGGETPVGSRDSPELRRRTTVGRT